MKFSIILFLIILLSFIYSCSDDVCNEETDTLLNFEFTVSDTALSNNGFVENIAIYSLEWADSIYYSEDGSNDILSLMLSPYSDTSEFIITSKGFALNDNLTIISQRELIFFSDECGFITEFLIDTVLHSLNYIDSIDISSNKVTTSNNGQIQIYF